MDYLEEAINNYQNGWHQYDYYTGENLATCYLLKSEVSKTTKEQDGFKFMAMQIYENIIPILEKDITTASDKKWPYATMSNSKLAIGELSSAEEYEKKFLDCKLKDWERKTFYETKEIIERNTRMQN